MEIPENHVGLIFPRSSNAKMDLSLGNCVGVIDSGYRGPIGFIFKLRYMNPLVRMWRALRGRKDKTYSVGDRIGQIIIMPYPTIVFEEADELSESKRGENGWGSTGK